MLQLRAKIRNQGIEVPALEWFKLDPVDLDLDDRIKVSRPKGEGK